MVTFDLTYTLFIYLFIMMMWWKGVTINSFDLNRSTYPLIWGGDAANYSAGFNKDISRFCFPGTLNSYQVAGKIVFCEAFWDGSGILMTNGVGTIMADVIPTDVAFSFPLPVTLLTVEDGQKVLDYIKSSELVLHLYPEY